VFDSNGEPLYSANISIVDGPTTTGATSDFDGEFKIKPLNSGTYTIDISFVGYTTAKITEVLVVNDKITFLNDIVLEAAPFLLEGDYTVTGWQKPIIDPYGPTIVTFDKDLLIKSPVTKNPVMLAISYTSDIQESNNQMIVRGSRPGSSSVYVDGMKVSDETTSLPSMSIGSVEIYTGGIPAKYGDVTGGVVMMTMKGYFDILNERRASESRQ